MNWKATLGCIEIQWFSRGFNEFITITCSSRSKTEGKEEEEEKEEDDLEFGIRCFFIPMQWELSAMLKSTTRWQRNYLISPKLISETRTVEFNDKKRRNECSFQFPHSRPHSVITCLVFFFVSLPPRTPVQSS